MSRGPGIVSQVAALVAALGLLGVAGGIAGQEGGDTTSAARDPAGQEVSGVVVDETGQSVAGASVSLAGRETTTDDTGAYHLAATGAGTATFEAPGHLPRVVVVEPGVDATVPLSSRAEETVSLRFGGDVMMGRRFYEAVGDRDPLIASPDSLEDHAAVLEGVAPLLEDADISMVNLETPLTDEPYYDPEGPRPDTFHPTKDFAFATSTVAAQALADAGVDVVSLANNHSADALDEGLERTAEALDAAGVAHFGAGRTVAEAWAPAFVEARGHTVAYLGCTTVSGKRESRNYVAGPEHGGAAECAGRRLAAEVSAAAREADTVVVSLHGDQEYKRLQNARIRRLARIAQANGAHVVVGHHPHVAGGLKLGKRGLFAETLGNIVFDQSLWDTYPTYLLRVDVRAGRPVMTTTDPIVIEDFRPEPAVAAAADAINRLAAGTIRGRTQLTVPGTTLHRGSTNREEVEAVLPRATPRRLARGWWIDPTSAPGIQWGSDLMYGLGTFDPATVRPDDEAGSAGSPMMMMGQGAGTSPEAACADGMAGSPDDATDSGALVARGPGSDEIGYAAQGNRTRVTPRTTYSLMVDVRKADPGSKIQLHWYTGSTGSSSEVSTLELPVGEWDYEHCHEARLDVVAPAGSRYAQAFVTLEPLEGGQSRRLLGADNIRLVEWTSEPVTGQRYDTVESSGGTTVVAVTGRSATGDPFVE